MSDIIQVTYGELTTSFDNEVMKAVQQVGINVNKDELLKALELVDKLVQCEECKHQKDCDRMLVLNSMYGEIGDYANLDFCSYGERKED